MKQQEWWIYQKRKVPDPWAIHISARKDRRRCIEADVDFYADWFYTDRFHVSNMVIRSTDAFVERVGRILDYYDHPLLANDKKQLREEIEELKEKFKD